MYSLDIASSDTACRCRRAHYPPHSLSGLTTHLIRRGTFTVTYPKDATPTKETFSVGARVDVPAGKVHEVWIGEEGESRMSSLTDGNV